MQAHRHARLCAVGIVDQETSATRLFPAVIWIIVYPPPDTSLLPPQHSSRSSFACCLLCPHVVGSTTWWDREWWVSSLDASLPSFFFFFFISMWAFVRACAECMYLRSLPVTGRCLTFVEGFECLLPPLLPPHPCGSRGNKSSLILPDQDCCPPQLYQPVN